MGKKILIDPETYNDLKQLADREGETVDEYANEMLEKAKDARVGRQNNR